LPGITIRWNIKKEINHDYNNIEYYANSVLHALSSIAYDKGYRQEILLIDHSCVVACNRYPNYPVKIFNDDNFWICIEGRIYGKEDRIVKKELSELLDYVFSDYVDDMYIVKGNRNNKLVNWLLKTDGDFIIYALDRKNMDLIIINDILGRLPLYYYYDNHLGLIISREIQFAANLIEYNNGKSDKFDRMAVAQFLLCGYTLGKRTLLRDVYRMEPGSIIRLYNYNKEINIDNVYYFNFEDKEYANENVDTSASKLVSLFNEACKNRANLDTAKKNILSLSGGFDSRCILVSLSKNKIPCSAVTVARPSWSPIVGNKSETEIAQILANKFGAEWESYPSPIQPTSEDLCKLLESKQGLSYIGYSFLLPFLYMIRENHTATITFFTGHGGDAALPDLTPTIKLHNLDDLINYIISRPTANVSLPLCEVASAVGIDKSQIVAEIKKILSSYPEKSLEQKYVHFLIYERVL
jgi:asparagine synthase (glutamine-hydrolysing)